MANSGIWASLPPAQLGNCPPQVGSSPLPPRCGRLASDPPDPLAILDQRTLQHLSLLLLSSALDPYSLCLDVFSLLILQTEKQPPRLT